MSVKGVVKSLGLTVLGIFLFLVRSPGWNRSFFNEVVARIQDFLDPVHGWVLFVFIGLSLAGTICGTCFHCSWVLNSERWSKSFLDKKMQLVTLSVAFFVVCSWLFFPLDWLNGESDSLMTMCADMIVFMLVAKLILPLLSDYGFSEFLEVYLRPVMKPLLRVPGAAVMHILTGMFVSVTVAVVSIVDLFQKSVYNRREAVIMITCLTVPSMPFVMLVLNTVGEADHFGMFYLYLCVVSLLVSFFVVRIFPINKIPETYVSGALVQEETKITGPKWRRAMDSASRKALATGYHPVENVVGMLLNMIGFIPYTLAWGTLMKLIMAYTPVAEILTKPYAMWLGLFGIPEAGHYSPVLILNFIDVVMPTVLLTDLNQPQVVLRILCMTLGEMVYIAPLLIALATEGLTNLKEQGAIWLLRAILLVPPAAFLFGVFFPGL